MMHKRKNRQRGFSLVEMMITVVAGSVVLVATASLYGFVALRTSDALIQYNAINDVQVLYGELGDHISHAIKAEVIVLGGRDILKLTMPQNGVDRDGDGIFDTWNILDVNKMNKEVYGSGIRLWYYTSDLSGDPTRTGNFVFRAVRNDDTAITATDVDIKWSFVNSNNPRVYIPGALTLANDTVSRVTTISANLTSGVSRPDGGPLAGSKSQNAPALAISKRFYWRAVQ